MSNVGRPREGMKPCPHCGAKDRDSNGQCRCRNTLYRLAKGLTKAQKPQAAGVFNEALAGKAKNLDKAVSAFREAFPTVKATKKAAAKKTVAKKAAASTKRTAPKKEDKVEVEKPAPERYVLVVDDFEETPYARKDAAVKNGLRSGKAWKVIYKGKQVAGSDDLL